MRICWVVTVFTPVYVYIRVCWVITVFTPVYVYIRVCWEVTVFTPVYVYMRVCWVITVFTCSPTNLFMLDLEYVGCLLCSPDMFTLDLEYVGWLLCSPNMFMLDLKYVQCLLCSPVPPSLCPAEEEWSDEACLAFEELTHCAKWKVLSARTVGYDDDLPCIQLVDNAPDQVGL